MQIQTNLRGRGTEPVVTGQAVALDESRDRVLDARETIERQAMAIAGLASQVGPTYSRAVDLILSTKGRLVVCGMGKSGNVARKLTATFSSTGTPSFFLHPADAIHGDLGMVTADDVVLMLSYSGETEEVVRLVPLLRRTGASMIALVGTAESTLGRECDVALVAFVEGEVCPNGLAPTTSTLAAMALGDALAVTLMREREFSARDFAQRHPGGTLGRNLLRKVRDEMRTLDLPIVKESTSVADCVCVITAGRLGLAVVMRGKRVVGVVTDGDLRRALAVHADLGATSVQQIMTPSPRTIGASELVADAETRMQRDKVKALIVVGSRGHLEGVFDIFRK